MSPRPDVFFITQPESRKSILGKLHSGNIFPRVLERFNWSSKKENNSGVCVYEVIQEEVVSACLLNGMKYFNLQWKCQLLSCFRLFESLWTAAHQAPLSMGFSRQEYWIELPFPISGLFPIQGLHLISCTAGRFYTIWATKDAPYRKGIFLSAWYRGIWWFLRHVLCLKVPGFWGEGTTTVKITLF